MDGRWHMMLFTNVRENGTVSGMTRAYYVREVEKVL
jgi:hypothetical protein